MRAACALLAGLALHGLAQAEVPPPALPTFAELEAMGARIGEIRIVPQEIFDLADPREDKPLFRLANRLHIETRPGVIARALLFRTGEPVSVQRIEETERLLRANRYLYDVQIRPVAWHDGVVDLEVATRDTWSLDPGVSAGRSGGVNSTGLNLHEYNLLGTGVLLSLGHSRTIDRSSNEFRFANERAFGTWTSVSYGYFSNSDGQGQEVEVARPFYALDARWAAGVKSTKSDRIESVYNAGQVASQYRYRLTKAEVFAGRSPGLVDGWVHRYSLGVSLQDEASAAEPGRTAPARLGADERLVAPFVRYEVIEDRYEQELNRNLIGRPEYFALGFASKVQLGWATTGLGSSREALLYAGSVSRGFEPYPDHTLITVAKISGQYADRQIRRQLLGVQAHYYRRQSKRWLFYAAAFGDMATRPDPIDELVLGGEDGLRGYPLRYQAGTRRALLTLEERFYTDLYVWRLFRVGGAAFFDVGRAWGGDNTNRVHPGWLANAGMGLRIVSVRSAFSNVLHLDLALPLHATPDVKGVQFLVKTSASF